MGLTTGIPVVVIIIIALFPFVWTFITSIKPGNELYTPTVRYWPKNPTLENYPLLFQTTPFGRYFLNSTIVSVCTVALGLTVSASAAYAFSRYRFRGRDVILFAFLIINMFPQILLLVPLLVIMRSLHLLNTYLSLIIAYSTFTIPFSVWMLTGFFDALPRELEEAAKVDGATGLQAFLKVVLPMAAPGIAATAIYIFINAWNEFLYALTFTTGIEARTVPVGLRTFIGAWQIKWELLTAAGVLSSLPIVLAFIFIQKQLIRGLTAGAVKG
jgi:multiple sugar transport system permease protein